MHNPEKRPLKELIYQEISSRILAGKLQPDTQLVERQMADELGVSRMSLRDAFALLEERGFIRIIPRRGAFVISQNAHTPPESSTKTSLDIVDDPATSELYKKLQRKRTLESDPNYKKVEVANKKVIERLQTADAVLTNIVPAWQVMDGFEGKMILHAGPPIQWENMCGTMRGAMIGAVLYEGWAHNENTAVELLGSGEIKFKPTHDYRCVAPMAGVVTPSMSVMVVENTRYSVKAYSPLPLGGAHTLAMGAYDKKVINRLHWVNNDFSEVMSKALQTIGQCDIRSLMIQGLQMGDEMHNHTKASSLLWLKEFTPAIATQKTKAAVASLEFLCKYDNIFLNVAMAASKTMLLAANNIKHSSIITVLARNGVEFGIQVSGLGNQWFTAPSPYVNGVFFPGYGMQDADRDIGDSAITETLGFGALAGAASPLVSQIVGCSPAKIFDITQEMYKITADKHDAFRIPALDFSGIPLGIDLRKVYHLGLTPYIDTAIAHRKSGKGQIGSGLASSPLGCFHTAYQRFMEEYPK
ncbi:MAG: DUF1116 domain-containing protein [Actinomycetaceae bacterium]|nr:DUF1116 domain-containing protein [Actinomycetaceae bacterium]